MVCTSTRLKASERVFFVQDVVKTHDPEESFHQSYILISFEFQYYPGLAFGEQSSLNKETYGFYVASWAESLITADGMALQESAGCPLQNIIYKETSCPLGEKWKESTLPI